jgi:hypothetical protein
MDDETKTQFDATNATTKDMPDLNAVRRVVNEAQSTSLVNAKCLADKFSTPVSGRRDSRQMAEI